MTLSCIDQCWQSILLSLPDQIWQYWRRNQAATTIVAIQGLSIDKASIDRANFQLTLVPPANLELTCQTIDGDKNYAYAEDVVRTVVLRCSYQPLWWRVTRRFFIFEKKKKKKKMKKNGRIPTPLIQLMMMSSHIN